MGASPSRESSPLFSYFRGSYETGLIPLTKHFFGLEEDENNSIPTYVPLPSSHPPSRRRSAAVSSLTLTDRRELRRQLLQVLADPAILYSMARDKEAMRRTMLEKLRKRAHAQSKKPDGCSTGSPGAVASEGMETEEMKVPHQDQDSTGEPKMNPSPHHHRSSSTTVAERRTSEGPSTAPEQESTFCTMRRILSEPELELPSLTRGASPQDQSETMEQWMREPAVSTEEAEQYLQENFWDVIPESNCSDEELDRFLELVDEMMYETDQDMVLDPRYQRDTPHGPQQGSPPPSATEDGNVSSLSGKRMPKFYAPIPCALCLAYPPAKAREGCWMLEGRFINIIGFFGCFTPEMLAALKITKTEADVTEVLENQIRPQTSPEDPVKNSNVMYLSAAILTSAGDRTLERVLALAAVMMRQQFHTASRKVLLSQQRKQQQQQQPPPGPLLSGPGAHVTIPEGLRLPPPYLPSDRSLKSVSLNHPDILEVEEQNIALMPLPLTPTGMFTPYTRHSSVADLPPDRHREVGTVESGSFATQHSSGCFGAVSFSEEDENAMTWNYFHRLKQLSLVIHTASNNYSSLKSLTENLAFLHCQLHIDPCESVLALIDLPEASQKMLDEQQHQQETEHKQLASDAEGSNKSECTETTVKDEATVLSDGEKGTESVRLSPSSTIALYITPHQFSQAAMWASGVLHYPQLKGMWIQYKLKDESEELRQTLQRKDELIAAWRRADPNASTSYLGPHTARLLAHVRGLQQETERARALQPEHWATHLLMDKDGRRYALHSSAFGAMLIGVRRPDATATNVGTTSTHTAHPHASGASLNRNIARMNNPNGRKGRHTLNTGGAGRVGGAGVRDHKNQKGSFVSGGTFPNNSLSAIHQMHQHQLHQLANANMGRGMSVPVVGSYGLSFSESGVSSPMPGQPVFSHNGQNFVRVMVSSTGTPIGGNSIASNTPGLWLSQNLNSTPQYVEAQPNVIPVQNSGAGASSGAFQYILTSSDPNQRTPMVTAFTSSNTGSGGNNAGNDAQHHAYTFPSTPSVPQQGLLSPPQPHVMSGNNQSFAPPGNASIGLLHQQTGGPPLPLASSTAHLGALPEFQGNPLYTNLSWSGGTGAGEVPAPSYSSNQAAPQPVSSQPEPQAPVPLSHVFVDANGNLCQMRIASDDPNRASHPNSSQSHTNLSPTSDASRTNSGESIHHHSPFTGYAPQLVAHQGGSNAPHGTPSAPMRLYLPHGNDGTLLAPLQPAVHYSNHPDVQLPTATLPTQNTASAPILGSDNCGAPMYGYSTMPTAGGSPYPVSNPTSNPGNSAAGMLHSSCYGPMAFGQVGSAMMTGNVGGSAQQPHNLPVNGSPAPTSFIVYRHPPTQ